MKGIPLKTIQDYCKDKSVIIVGNSSAILESEYGKFIDSHQVVVRMNYALPVNPKYAKSIGRNTHIYVAGISRSRIVESLINRSSVKYVLRLTPWGEMVRGNNIYFSTKDEYSKIKRQFGEFKPSSGCLAINFFKENIDYKSLSIIGFDFFTKADRIRKNEFKSYLYRDHDIEQERKYILKCLDSKTKFIKM